MQTISEEKTPVSSSSSPVTLTLDVSGMKCAGCVKAVENQLNQQAGVCSATVNLVTEVAMVEYQPDLVSGEILAQMLTEGGFPSHVRWASDEPVAQPQESLISPAEKQQQETQKQFRQVAIAAILLIFSTIGHLKHLGWVVPVLSAIWFHWALATITLLGPGRPILVDGWRGLRHHIPNMNTLVGLGTLASYLASAVALAFPALGWECFFDEPVMLMGFILLGRALEQRARGQAATAFQSLLSLQPDLARLIDEKGNIIELPAHRVQVGDRLQVLPGDKIPVDGQVVEGETMVNESMLTGESMPVLKQTGNFLAAGSLNQSGAIAMQATRTGKDTTLSQIIALVETAQIRKAPVQQLADTVAGYFTYGVLAIALLTFLFWYFLGANHWADLLPQTDHALQIMHGQGMDTGHSLHSMSTTQSLSSHSRLLLSLKRAIAVLVVACPCALGLATPTAILVGSSLGAERGILIRGGDVLEKVHRLTTVVFDKTGTLTTGQPTVTDCVPLVAHLTTTDLLQLAATVESGTRHPLAEAIQKKAQQEEISLLAADHFSTKPGYGASAAIAGQTVLLGTQTWLRQQEISISDLAEQTARALVSSGKTVVYVAVDHQLVGLIAVSDQLRADAKATVDQLHQMGLKVILLTGDQPATAESIAQSLGLSPEQVLADVRPEGKVKAIANLQQQGNCVAMVGDGINDSPALAQADVSISLHSGTATAIETAEIILMYDRLLGVVESIQLSQATFAKIWQNLFWALAYNIVGIPAAAGFLAPISGLALSPAMAGALMAFSSVSVVTNSLLLRRFSASQS
jgi:Cu2+-exporting ATPase